MISLRAAPVTGLEQRLVLLVRVRDHLHLGVEFCVRVVRVIDPGLCPVEKLLLLNKTLKRILEILLMSYLLIIYLFS